MPGADGRARRMRFRKVEPGATVWAFQKEDAGTVWVYGLGTYLGDALMPGWDSPGLLAVCVRTVVEGDLEPPIIDPHVYYGQQVTDGKMTRDAADAEIARAEAADAADKARPVDERARELARHAFVNPKISLNSGGTVWGIECFWIPITDETQVGRFIGGRTVVDLPAPHPAGEAEAP
jgi:hypothetical protein